MLGGLFYLNSLDRSIFSRCDDELLFLSLPCFIETDACNSNSVDPDQTPRSAASDLDLTVCQCPFHGTPGINGLLHTACALREDRSDCMDVSLRRSLCWWLRIFRWTAKTLINLCGCAGWSESSLDAHAVLLEMLCAGLYRSYRTYNHLNHSNKVMMKLILKNSILSCWTGQKEVLLSN